MTFTLISPIVLSGTTSSGSLVLNTESIKGIIRAILVNPATQTTQFNVKLTDKDSIDYYENTAKVGCLSEERAMPTFGVTTVTISGATADEAFIIKLMMQS